MKLQITNHKFQINHNDQNSKLDSTNSFGSRPRTVCNDAIISELQCFGY